MQKRCTRRPDLGTKKRPSRAIIVIHKDRFWDTRNLAEFGAMWRVLALQKLNSSILHSTSLYWFKVENQTFAQIQREKGAVFSEIPFEGILGLAFPSMSAHHVTPFFDSVIQLDLDLLLLLLQDLFLLLQVLDSLLLFFRQLIVFL